MSEQIVLEIYTRRAKNENSNSNNNHNSRNFSCYKVFRIGGDKMKMVTAAHFEDSMQEYENILKNPNVKPDMAVNIKVKAVKDTVDVLKQFGYDQGADIFASIMMKMYG